MLQVGRTHQGVPFILSTLGQTTSMSLTLRDGTATAIWGPCFKAAGTQIDLLFPSLLLQ